MTNDAARDGPDADVCAAGRVEAALLANRPALEEVVDGCWVWRFARGYTRRANSLQSLDAGDDGDVEARLARHWTRSRRAGIAPCFRVTPLTPPAVLRVLERNGFQRQGHSLVMVCSDPGEVVSGTFAEGGTRWRVLTCPVSDPDWQKAIMGLEDIGAADRKVFGELLGQLPSCATGLLAAGEDGQVVGAAYGSCSGKVASIFSVIVARPFRGQGIGTFLMRRFMGWSGRQGADCLALQVVADNGAAISLYSKLGFAVSHAYHYRMLNR